MIRFDADRWARPNIRKLIPYSSARDEFSGEDYIFLDANESPFESGLNRYPDPYQSEVRKKIAEMKGCDVGQIFLGNGSDEAIDLLYRCFAEPAQDKVLSIAPSYGMYRVCADINNVEFDTVLLNEDFSLNAERLLDQISRQTKIVFLCSPNNPSGNKLEEEAVRKVLDNFRGLVVIDEAYQDFAGGDSFLKMLGEYQNLVILQTFSKAWGMAAARMGMAFADPSIIRYLLKVKYPYNINILSQRAMIKALDQKDKVGQNIRIIKEEREKVISELNKIKGIEKVYPSDANFVLIKVDDPRMIYRELINRGIVIRDRSSVPLCEGCLRITIGTPEENKNMLYELRTLMENGEWRIENRE
jgi:histidinol-phosphate aminotransferase